MKHAFQTPHYGKSMHYVAVYEITTEQQNSWHQMLPTLENFNLMLGKRKEKRTLPSYAQILGRIAETRQLLRLRPSHKRLAGICMLVKLDRVYLSQRKTKRLS
jgi:hypothetical protein